MKRIKKFWGFLFLLSLFFSMSAFGDSEINSSQTRQFAKIKNNKKDRINLQDLKQKEAEPSPYLKWVFLLAKENSEKEADSLVEKYKKLQVENPKNAERFLRGLQFEIDQKLEVANLTAEEAHGENRELKKWVQRFLPIWHQEIDDLSFYAQTQSIME